jgi:peptidoglycan DL-endopeptidase CwlO
MAEDGRLNSRNGQLSDEEPNPEDIADEEAFAAPSVAPPDPRAAAILRAAHTQLGTVYREVHDYQPGHYIDCSGLVQYSLRAAGINVPRTSEEQWGSPIGTRVPISQMRPGDVLSINNGSGTQPGHTAIYAGNGRIIVASSSAGRVIYQRMSVWNNKIIGVKRY